MGPEIGTCIGIDASVVWMSSSSMLGRVAALIIRDLSRSRVIFLALARGQELVVPTFILY
jgi:hypothetical protein